MSALTEDGLRARCEMWKARALAAEADREATRKDSDAWQMQWRTVSAERDEARAEVERLREALAHAITNMVDLQSAFQDERPGYWLHEDSIAEARAALSPSPPDTEEH